mgnify:FL=1
MNVKLNIKQLLLKVIPLLSASLLSSFAYAETAKGAWTALVAENFRERPEFAFVENNQKLPNVLIYGDSISIHYTQAVRAVLEGKANVYRLYLNGGDSKSFIRKMTKMHQTMQDKKLLDGWRFNWDVIHFNVGLHDLKYTHNRKLDKVNGQQITSLSDYEKNLRANIQYLKLLAPKAKLIFATTTPIPEGELGRVVGDAAKYNEVALKVMQAYPEILINDLYHFTKPNHEKWWASKGNVHYNSLGRQAQGKEVAKKINSQLQH